MSWSGQGDADDIANKQDGLTNLEMVTVIASYSDGYIYSVYGFKVKLAHDVKAICDCGNRMRDIAKKFPARVKLTAKDAPGEPEIVRVQFLEGPLKVNLKR